MNLLEWKVTNNQQVKTTTANIPRATRIHSAIDSDDACDLFTKIADHVRTIHDNVLFENDNYLYHDPKMSFSYCDDGQTTYCVSLTYGSYNEGWDIGFQLVFSAEGCQPNEVIEKQFEDDYLSMLKELQSLGVIQNINLWAPRNFHTRHGNAVGTIAEAFQEYENLWN